MAWALHPTVQARGYRVDVAVRISQVLTHHSPPDVGLVNSLANGAAVGVGVREETFFSHAAAVVASHRQKVFKKGEPRKPASPAHPVHFVQALLLERLDLANAAARE